jgi:predicted protein tyrosine phosphatase
MEKKHAAILQRDFPAALAEKSIHCVGIPDEYEFMNKDLIVLLEGAVEEFIQR